MIIKIIKYKQFFTITNNDLNKLTYALHNFNKKLITFKQVKKGKLIRYEEDKYYYIKDLRNNLIRYPISLYDSVLDYLHNIGIIDIEIINNKPPKGKNIKIKTTYDFKLKKYQKEYIDYLTISDIGNALLALPTGYGKTVTVLTFLSNFKKRFGVFVLPRYIPKWIEDITKYTDLKEEDIYIVDSGVSLNKIMTYDKKQMNNIKVIIFSLSTLKVYINKWLKYYEEFTYNLEPDELTSFLGLEYIINDETHQDYHNVFTTNLFFTTKMFIGITATLESNDNKITELYNVMFPPHERAKIHIPINRYIIAISIKYYFKNMNRLRYKGPFGYNHNILEATIIKSKFILDNYLEMIMRIILNGYIKDRKPGDKILVFVSKVEMCELLVEYLNNSKCINDVNITKYTQENDYDVISKNDIIISTIGSAGTALDIPNLINVIQTIPMDSVQANKQTLGRLRDIPDRDVKFYYLWSGNVRQHSGYNYRRMTYFNKLAKMFMNKVYQKSI